MAPPSNPAGAELHPVLAALDRAPIVRRLTDEQRAELDRAVADIAAGCVKLVAQDDVPAALEALSREDGA